MRMNRIFLLVAGIAVLGISGCGMFGDSPVSLEIGVRLSDDSTKAVTAGDAVTTIDHYYVTFTKIEIGNSEEDKFTLWESEDGEPMDIVSELNFSDVQEVYPGTYNYVRFQIENVLTVEGSIDDEGTLYEGEGTCTLSDTQYLFGTDIENFEGELTLSDAVVIVEGTSLVFEFDIDGTVFYQSGTADAAVLSVEKPVVSLVVE